MKMMWGSRRLNGWFVVEFIIQIWYIWVKHYSLLGMDEYLLLGTLSSYLFMGGLGVF
jgi:hypothetical protein